jgi:predicted DNA binding CopG/RHH family protein
LGESLDVSIRKKEAELQPLLSRMETLRLQFVNGTTGFAALWFEEKAKEYATKKHEITINLGKEQLAQMKVQVSNLSKKTPTE